MTDYISVLSVIFFALAILLSFALFEVINQKERDRHEVIASMTLDAVFIAIIMLMTFVPNIGFIAITPFLSLTLLHLPVLLGAALGGPKKGLLLGLVFGIASYMQALSGTGFNALFAFPWVAIPPRAAFGLLAGLTFSLLGKIVKKSHYGLYLALASAVMTAIHTGLVFLDLYICYPAKIAEMFGSSEPVASGTTWTFLLVILVGMAGEMAVAAIVTPPLYLAVDKVRRRRKH